MTQNVMLHQYDEAFLNKTIDSFPKIAIFFCFILILLIFFMPTGSTKIVLCCIVGFFAYRLGKDALNQKKLEQRLNFILNTPLPSQLWQNQDLRQLNLSSSQKALIENALQDYFILHALYPTKPLAMPSVNVDKLWHAFILDTRHYQDYCQQAFGKVFHHIPDYTFADRSRNIELFTWQMGCRIQGISPANPLCLPRLFATDMLLTGAVIGTVVWDSYQTQMALMYRQWHAQNYSSSTDSADAIMDIGTAYDDSCSVGLTDSGDASCSSSDGGSGDSSGDGGSSCGGGCGGGGGD